MAKASKTTAKKAEKKPAAKAEKSTGSPQVTTVREAPKPDKDRAPREDDIGRKERQDVAADVNAEEEGVDKVYGVSSRARWGNNDSIHELSQDAAEAEKSAAENRE